MIKKISLLIVVLVGLVCQSAYASNHPVISGTMTNAATGEPITSWITFYGYNSVGDDAFSGATSPDATGNYSIEIYGATSDGTYYLTAATDAYSQTLYSGITCETSCDVTSGTPITITAGATVSDINFELIRKGSISGTVTSDKDGSPIPNARIEFYRDTNQGVKQAASTNTDDSGNYVTPLTAGTYYLKALAGSYANKLYDNVACRTWVCRAATMRLIGLPVVVRDEEETSNINFSLAATGTITGTVTDETTGTPISGATLSIYPGAIPTYIPPTKTKTNQRGEYTFTELSPDKHYIRASTELHAHELYQNVPCPIGCDPFEGAAINVISGNTTAGIDFMLIEDVAIEGTIIDSQSDQPLPYVEIKIFNERGYYIGKTRTRIDGTYVISSLGKGSYYLKVNGDQVYHDQLFNGINCTEQCPFSQATSIEVVGINDRQTIDFSLMPRNQNASITGIIIDADTGDPIAGAEVFIQTLGYIPDRYYSTVRTDNEGRYAFKKLYAGISYYLSTSNNQPYVNSAYNNIYCIDECNNRSITPIQLTPGQQKTIDITLRRGGKIYGKIIDHETGEGISGVDVFIHFDDRIWEQPVPTVVQADLFGNYSTEAILPAGTYYAIAQKPSASNSTPEVKYVGQHYNGPACVSPCDPKNGEPIHINWGETATEVNFTLSKGGSISGTVTDNATGAPIYSNATTFRDSSVIIFDDTQKQLFSAKIGIDGRYATPSLPTGSYYAITQNHLKYTDQIYENIPCNLNAFCYPINAEQINVAAGEETKNINFALSETNFGVITGTVTDASTGEPLARRAVTIASASGLLLTTVYTDDSGRYTASAPFTTGTYYAYVHDTYSSSSSGAYGRLPYLCSFNCDPDLGDAISVVQGEVTDGIDIALSDLSALGGGGISGTITFATVGDPFPALGSITLYDSEGSEVIFQMGAYPDGTFDTGLILAAGTYYALAQTTAWNSSFIPQSYGGMPCMASCDATRSSPIVVRAGETTSNINFTLNTGGAITGTISDAQTDRLLRDMYIQIHNDKGDKISEGITNNEGVFRSRNGLPAGTYYVTASGHSSSERGFIGELYGAPDCVIPCEWSRGTAITIARNEVATDINFALNKGSTISGQIIDAYNRNTFSNTVFISDKQGNTISQSKPWWGEQTGIPTNHYSSAAGLPTGTYYAFLEEQETYVAGAYDLISGRLLYGGIQCDISCDPTQGTPIIVDGVNDISGIDFLIAPDADRDGLPDYEEQRFNLNALDGNDANEDLDGDGLSNIDEYRDGTSLTQDNSPPTLSFTNNLRIGATGPMTGIDFSQVTAIDLPDGEITPVVDNEGPFPPGRHQLTWSATDNSGNRARAVQTIEILPRVSFGVDQISGEGKTVTVTAHLNATAATYPVSAPYTVSGSASNPEDHNATSGTLSIDSGLTGSIAFNVVDDGNDGESDEQVVFTMTEPVNALTGPQTQHTVTITEANIPPMIMFTAQQDGHPTRIIIQDQGLVTITSAIKDPNRNENHQLDWSTTDGRLADSDGDVSNDTFVFDPATLPSGLYLIALTATDNGGAASTATLMLQISDNGPLLAPGLDSDGDGKTDFDEGYGDSDQDGVADHVDGAGISRAYLQSDSGNSESYLLITDAGLSLQLGDTAFASGTSGARITAADIANHGATGGGPASGTGDDHSYPISLFDFSVSGLNQPGDRARIVLPLTGPIPANASYRKFTASGGWRTFIENSNNQIASAVGLPGHCPLPGDTAYQNGLGEGDHCLQLTIEDGGPNDADGRANGVIKDPGGVALAPAPINSNSVGSKSGGGGSIGIGFVPIALALLMLASWRTYPRSRRYG